MLLVIFFTTLFLITLSVYKYGFLANPFVLEAYYTLFFLIVPQIILIYVGLGESYALSNWVILIYLISVYVGSQINIKAVKVTTIERGKPVAILCLILATLLIVPTLFILLNCGLNLAGIRCYYETVVFTKYAGLYDLGKTFLLIAILLLFLHYLKAKWWLILLVLIMVFSGSKFAIFNLLIFFCIYVELYKKIRIHKILLWSIPILILFILYHFSQTNNAENPMLAAISYFDIYEKQSFLLEKFENNKHALYYGEINLSSYYKFIPRMFWPDKPVAYGFAILNYDFLPEFAAENYMPSFGLGTLYADFGMASVIIGGLMAGFIRRYCYNIMLSSNYNNTSLIIYYFSISILTFQYIFVLVILSTILKKKVIE